jgi:hypothetical protein
LWCCIRLILRDYVSLHEIIIPWLEILVKSETGPLNDSSVDIIVVRGYADGILLYRLQTMGRVAGCHHGGIHHLRHMS